MTAQVGTTFGLSIPVIARWRAFCEMWIGPKVGS